MKLQRKQDYQSAKVTDNVQESIRSPQLLPQMETDSSNTVSKSQEEMAVTEQQQTTKFTNDGIAVESKPWNFHSLSSLFTASSDSNNSMDIKNFLGKPILITSGNFSTSDLPTTVLYQEFLPTVLTNNTLFRNKLSGFLGMRATIVLRWVINGTPFHQGRYMLYHIPLGGARITAKESDYFDLHRNTLFERTQLQRLELDVSCDTEGVMKIPFSSVLNFFPLRNTNPFNFIGNTGMFAIQPYVPLQTVGGTSEVGYSLYAHFEDVELIGSAVPQMGISPSEKESKAGGGAPVSSTILAFSKATAALNEVPFISSFASTTSWALDIMGKTAKAAGFSKPQMYNGSQRMIILPAPYLGNVDGFDQSITLGASSENTVPVLPGFAGTDVDEMSLSNITSIPAFFHLSEWNPGNAIGSTIHSFELRPDQFQQVRIFAARAVYNHTPVSFIGNMFTKWRGSFKFRIKIIKTPYHSGRLSINFNPTNSKLTNPAWSNSLNPYLHREIVDIRTCNQVEFSVPYVNLLPWLDSAESFGTIYVNVVDILSAPSNVPSTISLAFEVSGGPDLEFAIPSDGIHTDALGCSGVPSIGITPQMGEDPCSLLTTVIGADNHNFASVMNSEVCIGEKIISLRTLGKIFRPQRVTSIIPSGVIESSMPFSTQIARFNGGAWTPQMYHGDFIDLVSACYLYSRGSVRIKKFLPVATARFMLTSVSTMDTFPTNVFTRGNVDLDGVGINAITQMGGRYALHNVSDTNGVIEVTVPQYNDKHSRLVAAEGQISLAGYYYSPGAGLACGVMLNTCGAYYIGNYPVTVDESSVGFVNYRAMGDDFSLGGFISTVPTQYEYTPGEL